MLFSEKASAINLKRFFDNRPLPALHNPTGKPQHGATSGSGDHMQRLILAILIPFLLLACAAEQKVDTAAIGDKLHKAYPDLEIDGIRESPVKGLYEVRAGRNIFYSDSTGDHLVVRGQIIEVASKRNLTRERIVELSRIDWSILPLDKAIVSGDENAELKLAVFTDPDCPYCQKLERELKNLSGVKVYTFLYPLTQLHPEAYGKSEAIWCSENRHEAFLKVIMDREYPRVEKCDTPLDEIATLAKKLGITGTPTLFAGDGRMASGAIPAEDLKTWLSEKPNQ